MITAAVLAGGLGSRLRSVVGETPKVLARVRGRHFLEYLLDQLSDAGIGRVVLCTGYGADQVQAAFGRRFRDLDLVYSRESQPLGTAGALRAALCLADSDPLLVLNGDSYCDFVFDVFLEWHRGRRARASVLLAEVVDASRFGAVRLAPSGEIMGFEEKGCQRPAWVNAGVYLLSRPLLESIPEGVAVSLERECFPSWVGNGLFGCAMGKRFLDIGTPHSYQQAEEFFAFAETPGKESGVGL